MTAQRFRGLIVDDVPPEMAAAFEAARPAINAAIRALGDYGRKGHLFFFDDGTYVLFLAEAKPAEAEGVTRLKVRGILAQDTDAAAAERKMLLSDAVPGAELEVGPEGVAAVVEGERDPWPLARGTQFFYSPYRS